MNIYTEHLTFQTKQKREFINITEHVKAALQRSGFHDGFALISALHSNSAIFVNDDEPGLIEDVAAWLGQALSTRRRLQAQGALRIVV